MPTSVEQKLSPLQEHHIQIAKKITNILDSAPKGPEGEIFIPDIYPPTSEPKPTKTRYLEKIRFHILAILQEETGLSKEQAYRAIGMKPKSDKNQETSKRVS